MYRLRGMCAGVSVKAIFYQDELQPEHQRALARQAEVFSEIGSPGGARAFGRLPADHRDRGAASPAALIRHPDCALRRPRRVVTATRVRTTVVRFDESDQNPYNVEQMIKISNF